MNIAVLFGGLSLERNVSLAGGYAVCKALESLGHRVLPVDPALGKNGLINLSDFKIPDGATSIDELKKHSPKNIIECINSPIFDDVDMAFIVLHGKYGEDGRIQSLLELRGIPYTGSGVRASATAIDKLTSKLLFLAAGVMTPNWITVNEDDIGNYEYYESIRDELGNKTIIKPVNQGSTIGISTVHHGNLDDIHNGIIEAAKYSKRIIIEEFIEGRELTVGIVGDTALPIIEIVPESGFYDYEHKYTSGKTEYICPANIDENIEEFLQNSASTAYKVLGCSGFGRIDFRMDDDGRIFCLEANTIPGFTATSLVPKAAQAMGIEFPELCSQIIELALKK